MPRFVDLVSIRTAAEAIDQLPLERRQLVAIDGVDGAGKTTFADLLATVIDRPAVRASCDDFHNSSSRRYLRGNDSAEGFYLDSFDYDSLEDLLLQPFATGERFRTHAFDYRTDRQIDTSVRDAPRNAVLILDGLFLHRSRLRDRWDLSVLLDVSTETAAARLERRDGRPPSKRYTDGQDIYFADAAPRSHASLILPW